MTERIFKVGQRVRLSPKGRQCQPHLVQTGTVLGFHQHWPDVVKVVRDGNKCPSYYHESLWEALPEEGGSPHAKADT